MTGEDFSIRTDAAKLREIDRLALAQNQTRDIIINEAIDRYLAEEQRWAEKIQAGLTAANAGDFATDAELEAIFDFAAANASK